MIKPGAINTELIQNLDYAETFLDVAGAEIPADMQGRSLVPLFRGEPTDWRDSLYYHYHEYPSVHMVAKHFGIRTKQYKLIRFYQFDEWEFYDLEGDPEELANQYSNPKYETVIAELKADLDELRSQYADNTDISVMPAEWQKEFRP